MVQDVEYRPGCSRSNDRKAEVQLRAEVGRDMALHLAGQGSDIGLSCRSEAGETQAIVTAIQDHARRAAAGGWPPPSKTLHRLLVRH